MSLLNLTSLPCQREIYLSAFGIQAGRDIIKNAAPSQRTIHLSALEEQAEWEIIKNENYFL
jgi:hypothetical protein